MMGRCWTIQGEREAYLSEKAVLVAQVLRSGHTTGLGLDTQGLSHVAGQADVVRQRVIGSRLCVRRPCSRTEVGVVGKG